MLSEEMLKRMEELNFNEEQINFVRDELIRDFNIRNGYKIMVGRPIICRKQHFNGYTFYKIGVAKKNKDGKKEFDDRNIRFIGCEPPREESSKIVIKHLYEDFNDNKRDKYNKIYSLVVTEYELVDKEKEERLNDESALDDYRNELYDLNDSSLPF